MKRVTSLAIAVLTVACASDRPTSPGIGAPNGSDGGLQSEAVAGRRTIFGIDESNRLLSFRPSNPAQILSLAPITGLSVNERIVAIDFRPATGGLIGLSDGSRLYRIDPATGAATALGTSAFTPTLSGKMFGVDFNPTVDRVRVHSDAEQNIRLHPDLGTVAAVDTALAFAAGDPNANVIPDVVATAYTQSAFNNGVFPITTILYAIDQRTSSLVVLRSPNGGQLATVGPLGVSFGKAAGFDIATNDDIAYASLNATSGGRTGLYRIDLATGSATLIGAIGHTEKVLGISVQP
jgi:hypothetical protein